MFYVVGLITYRAPREDDENDKNICDTEINIVNGDVNNSQLNDNSKLSLHDDDEIDIGNNESAYQSAVNEGYTHMSNGSLPTGEEILDSQQEMTKF